MEGRTTHATTGVQTDNEELSGFRHMDLPGLRRAASISEYSAAQVRRELDKRYHQALRRFVDDTDGLRSALRLFQAVISGSFAVRFLRHPHGTFIPNDLDIYVPRGFVNRVAYYLIVAEGYSFRRHEHNSYPDTTPHTPLASVLGLERGALRIDVIESPEATALYPIAAFWGSHVVNFVGADSYCLCYDDLTLQGRSLISPTHLLNNYSSIPDPVKELMDKYRGRGFEFRISPLAWGRDEAGQGDQQGIEPPHCNAGAGCPLVMRFFGDRFCAVGSLSATWDGTGFPRYLVSDLTVAWWRGGAACGGGCQHSVHAPEKRSPMSFVLNVHRMDVTL